MRKSFIITAVLIAAALGTLLLLAFNQFQLYGRHEAIISQTEKILFQYSNIREQIVEDIVEGQVSELASISPAVEELHNNLVKILDDTLIPAEYKFSFIQQIDLPGLVLLLRKTSTQPENITLLRRINEESRVIGERFMLFERLVLGHAKQKLVDFQSIVIGILALVVFLVTTLIVVIYRFLIAPVMNLAAQSQNLVSGQQEIIFEPRGWEEVSGLAEKLNLLAGGMRSSRDLAERYDRITSCLHEVGEKVFAAKDREVLFQSVCRSVLSNPDYVLAWIGEEDQEEKEIMPLVADGSTTMSCEECHECFSALLAAQEEEEPAYQAFKRGEPVIMTDVIEAAPKGPFKNTSLAEGRVDSISLPLVYNADKYGVLTIYTVGGRNIRDSEIELLSEMATLVAGKLHILNIRTEMDRLKQAGNIIGEHAEILSFILDQEGKVLRAESYFAASVYKDELPAWKGKPVTEFVLPENDIERKVFKDSIKKVSRYEFKTRLSRYDEQFLATLEPVEGFSTGQGALLLVLVAPQKSFLLQSENFKIAYSAGIGQFAGCIAHEITDMSNGIINYAQVMSDELGSEGQETKRNLERIIQEGEKIAAIVEPLLIDQEDLDFTRNMENIQQIFQDVLLLVDPLFKRDRITINLTVEPTPLVFKKQHVQLILFDLLKRLGEIVNRLLPKKEEAKVLDISVSPVVEEGKKMLLVNFQFPATSSDVMDRSLQQGSFPGMWLSQELARALGGEVTLRSDAFGKAQVNLLLPS